jgi:GNAT superfamily N-acetyltransferase
VNCTILPLADLDDIDISYIVAHLTKPGSDFQRALLAGRRPGEIAIVRDQGEIVGWARTEEWVEDNGGDEFSWDTLEAFVAKDYRRRGVAAFAAAGLAAAQDSLGQHIAVFHPHMLLVARRAGFHPTLFAKQDVVETKWSRV